jgi:uncharacterized protein YndB with AHSA1/START domain
MAPAVESRNDALNAWALDREIVLSRVISVATCIGVQGLERSRPPSTLVGPAGFTVETQEIEIRVGGKWRFVLVAPDGTRYDSRMVFRKIDAPRLLELDHGSDKDDDPGKFRVIVTFDEQSDGKTVLTLRQLHPTKEQRDATIGFGAVEFGYQTLEKLAQHIGLR